MLALPITYTDLNEEEITETFYFNFTTPELVKFEDSKKGNGGMKNLIRSLIEKNDAMGFISFVEELVKLTYGVKSEDNKRFIKNPAITAEFMQSNAYEVLYMNLLSDEGAIDRFITGVMPAKVRDEMTKQKEEDLNIQDMLGIKELGEPIKA